MRNLVISACCLLLAGPAFASVQSGQEKWKAGDWDGAVAEWLTPASRGDAEAMFNMGQAYRLGRGVPQNSATAIEHYRRAAEKGHVGAMTNLGISLYQEGHKHEALNQLRQAADKGDLRASYVLGVATFGGDGTPRNPALGYAYVARARDGGLAVASAQAARMATLMTADDRAKGEATAAALASGKPVAVVLAEQSAPRPAAEPVQVADASGAIESEDEAEEAPAKPVPAKPSTPAKARGAEKAASESRAKEKAADSAEAQGDGWKVQLGAYANQGAARTAWATLVSQSATLLKGQKPIYAPRGNLVRLQVGPYGERGEAAELCTKLAAAGRPCFVTR
ncbi:SPOR domain-containing protein [Sandaracinobacter sp. RS1-74]|uniref:SPOR domain-containing protein n=1 Tax=Sandaracinobacteroides sayramensis TaxID=2913411 RepID=UPI001ED9EA51|nr:SPOR domain-containing protein [Sandaracinobacteroides sayramensis]MCG2840583.1 SPOR domain-containing protein [Sandaracinobacteroides sayramensis]